MMNLGRELRFFYVCMIAVAALTLYGLYQTNHQSYVACKRVQNLQNYAILTINRSEKTLPTLAYYRNPDHARELARQIKFSEQYKHGFPHITCTKSVFNL